MMTTDAGTTTVHRPGCTRRPDVPCSGCGRMIWRGTGSLPAGRATCRDCRQAERRPYGPRETSPDSRGEKSLRAAGQASGALKNSAAAVGGAL